MLQGSSCGHLGTRLRTESGISTERLTYCKELVARSRQCDAAFESPSFHPSVLKGQRAQAAQTNAIK